MPSPWFKPALFHFLAELGANNNREWFQENKARYEAEVRDPLLAFIQAFAGPLAGISRQVLADPRPSGGSMFRIYRDTRFAHDKSPYKTNVGAQFRHVLCSRDVHAPGFYLHLEPGGCFTSAGLWHPDPAALKRVRDQIVAHPRAWKGIRAAGLDVRGEALVRVPPGFDPTHPLAEDLKLKDFYTTVPFTQHQVCAGDFLTTFTEQCARNVPLMKFLTKALDLPW
jgi:uncharacterized protein (TIGR02453 family)